ncbi:MAG: hypothetical protein ACOYNF_19665, partial [Rhodoferax sp.]
MSFTNFRNSFLTEAEARLDAVTVGTASNTQLLAAGAIYKMASAIAQADMIGPEALRLLETMDGAALEVWLDDATNSIAFNAVVTSATAMSAVAASATAMSAVAASATAMAAVNASVTALNELYASALVTKVSYNSGATWNTLTTIRNGAGLLVRLTTKAGVAGWGEG